MLGGAMKGTGSARSVRLVDGTTLSAPGSGAPTWRLVASFDPTRQRAVGLHLTPANVGEAVDATTLAPTIWSWPIVALPALRGLPGYAVSVVCRLPCGLAGQCGESWLSGRFDSVADLASWQASWFAPWQSSASK